MEIYGNSEVFIVPGVFGKVTPGLPLIRVRIEPQLITRCSGKPQIQKTGV